jgi:hypothetical protein
MTNRKDRRRGGKCPPFVMLPWYLLDSHAWHTLSPRAQLAYLQVGRLYDGSNNGRLAMSARRLASLIPCNKDTAAKVLREIEDAGFIDTIKIGKFTRKQGERRASEYRLTCFRCDVTGDPPSRRFNPKIRWEACDRPTGRDRSVRPVQTDSVSDQATVRSGRTVNAETSRSSVGSNRTLIHSSMR